MRLAALLLAAALLPLSAHASPRTETEHLVAEGETLNGIANRAGVSSKAIATANGLKPPYTVRSGQKLRIPRRGAGQSASTVNRNLPPDRESVHVVTEGETLGGIAHRAKVPRVLIAEANQLKPPFAVRTGQKLLIPRTRRYAVREGDTGSGVAAEYGVPWLQIAIANGIDPAAPLLPGKELLIPTVLDPAAAPAATRDARTESPPADLLSKAP
ncbi:LysM peptidoglycan-binding domain-containing protein [Novosphingobium rhizovicinum]|uniref:LysM peptidoglycan-binding domain-containing protein n=1 Tax=Novosphingobium rhizovicinum TaxID=3228928 RepID=A0ABV3R9N1_9SPHN